MKHGKNPHYIVNRVLNAVTHPGVQSEFFREFDGLVGSYNRKSIVLILGKNFARCLSVIEERLTFGQGKGVQPRHLGQFVESNTVWNWNSADNYGLAFLGEIF
jgi:hypothetical protein